MWWRVSEHVWVLMLMRPPPVEQCLTSLFLSSLFLHRKAETESGKFGDGKNPQWLQDLCCWQNVNTVSRRDSIWQIWLKHRVSISVLLWAALLHTQTTLYISMNLLIPYNEKEKNASVSLIVQLLMETWDIIWRIYRYFRLLHIHATTLRFTTVFNVCEWLSVTHSFIWDNM